MIVVTTITAPCPVCGGAGRRITEHTDAVGAVFEGVRPCLACYGQGRIRQAAHTTEETP